MIIYYSGSCGATRGGAPYCEPEHFKLPLMLSYFLISTKQQVQNRRFTALKEARKCCSTTAGVNLPPPATPRRS